MSKTEAIAAFAKAVLGEEKPVISTDELNMLIQNAESQQERDLYVNVYNYLLQRSQKEVVDSGEF